MSSEPFSKTVRSIGTPSLAAGGRPPSSSRRTLWVVLGGFVLSLLVLVMRRRPPASLPTPDVDRYTLGEKIGEGAMGEIFRAQHERLGRPTAIKIMRDAGSNDAQRRFERELQLTARLTHPNAISVFDCGRTRDGRLYYAMELLHGMTLEELVAGSGPLPAGRVIHLLLQACGALQEAHALGLVHRDIKPANIYVCSRAGWYDVVKVLDFGLARELERSTWNTFENIEAIVGTPLYLSPEAVCMPASLDARADIYALGAVAYFLLCGSPPFAAGTLWALCHHHLHSAPVPPSVRRSEPLAPDLEAVVLRCLAKDREERPQTALAFAELLRSCRDAGTWTEAEAASYWQPPAQPATNDRPRARSSAPPRCRELGA
jgi:eukaryotic-like serine/threonine-protein kinase